MEEGKVRFMFSDPQRLPACSWRANEEKIQLDTLCGVGDIVVPLGHNRRVYTRRSGRYEHLSTRIADPRELGFSKRY